MARITKRNIAEFQSELLKWYKASGRYFPWRKEGLSSYQIIISEILLQRTKAENVKSFYKKFLIAFPGWVALSRASQQELEKFLVPLGLYRQRAARLNKLAYEMVQRKSRLPESRIELDEMPFIGQYIGNAIELLIFHKPRPLLDVNMTRVLERYFGKRIQVDIRYDAYLQQLASRVVDHEFSKELNWAILDYAASVCSSRNPKCTNCRFASKCTYYKNPRNFSNLARFRLVFG